MDTPIEDSNLAFIGSDEDKAAREAAANLEMNWEGCGQSVGVEVWRVENKRHEETGNPNFGINVWPTEHYGEFYQGDSYIVLQTSENDEGAFYYDIYFWIGSASSQDEYGVAAYKANELDDLLGDAPVQHREIEGYESASFLNCFSNIRYLDGGIESGFREVIEGAAAVDLPTCLYQVRKNSGSKARSYLVEKSYKSLNEGDAFVLDAGTVVYTWYGSECSPFEKKKAIDVASSLVDSRTGQATLVQDVEGEQEDASFWEAIGGKDGDIAPASDVTDNDMPEEHASKMYILSDEDSQLKVTQIDTPSEEHLDTGVVCMIDIGTDCIIWIGKGANKREQSQAMTMVGTYLKNFGREHNTRISRVMEGQESRCSCWSKAFA